MKRQPFLLAVICVAAACADVQAPPAATQYARLNDAEVYQLVDIGMFNGEPTAAFEMNDHGAVYGRWGLLPGPTGSFRWTEKGGFEDLGGLDGQPFLILGNNKHDETVGSVPTGLPPSPTRSVVKLRGQSLRYLDDEAHFGSAWGINKHGVVVGARQTQPPSPMQGFMWTEANGLSILPIEFPAGTPVNFAAARINDAGTVLGRLVYRPPGMNRLRMLPYLWDAVRGTRLLPTLSEGNVGVTWLTESEFVAGAAETRLPVQGERRLANPLSVQSAISDVPIHAWRWSAATGLEDLGTLGGRHSVSWGTDEEGNAYGWADDAAGARHAVKWLRDGRIIRVPSLGGMSIIEPPNKHGIAAGLVTTPGGERHAALWVPVK